MYEELVKALRNCDEGSKYCCFTCPEDCNGPCQENLMKKAAEAIEELQKKYDGAVSDNKSLCRQIAELAKERNEAYSKGLLEGGIAQRAEDEKWIPQWISVTKRLPEDAYGCLAIVWDDNLYTGNTFLNYYPEFVGYGGGSWNDYNGDEIPFEVVYWMKLPRIPEPPKEE